MMTANHHNDWIDPEYAREEPGAAYPSPEAVHADMNLTDAQKIEILRRWASYIIETGVVGEEGTTNRGNGELLHTIMVAIDGLTGSPDFDRL